MPFRSYCPMVVSIVNWEKSIWRLEGLLHKLFSFYFALWRSFATHRPTSIPMGKRAWLDQSLADIYLPKIAKLSDTAKGHKQASELCQQLRQSWADRGLKALTQQQGLMDETRRVLKDRFGLDHFSLNFIKFTREEYVQINDKKQGRVADRNEAVQFLDNPDAIVAKAVRLLESAEWSDKAAGLSVLTGRRSSEILSQIEKVFKEGAQELTDHHQKHQLDPVKHNLRHRRKCQISNMVHLGDITP